MRPVYSRRNPRAEMFDRRPLGEYVYTAEVSIFVEKLFFRHREEAKSRISVHYQAGIKTWRYRPSPEYVRAITEFRNKINRTNGKLSP